MAPLIEEGALKPETSMVETDLGKLRETAFDQTSAIAQKYLDKATTKYGDKFQIVPLIKPSTAYDESGWRSSRGFGVWTFNRYGNIYVGVEVQGTLGGKSGKFIVLADGSMHSLTENRYGLSNLTVDANISTFSEPDLSGKKTPLYSGVEQIGETIPVSNNTEDPSVKDSRKKNNLFGLGTVLSDQANTRIEFWLVNSGDPTYVTTKYAERMAGNLQGRPQRTA